MGLFSSGDDDSHRWRLQGGTTIDGSGHALWQCADCKETAITEAESPDDDHGAVLEPPQLQELDGVCMDDPHDFK